MHLYFTTPKIKSIGGLCSALETSYHIDSCHGYDDGAATVFCDVTEDSVLRGRNRMLHNDVTEMNLRTH